MSKHNKSIGGPSEGHDFPDLTAIGRAFAEAITSINTQGHTNLQPEARLWLISFARKIMNRLRAELYSLRVNKNSPTLLPRYAFDPNCELKIFSDSVPFKLHPFVDQFLSYTSQLLKACGFEARPMFCDGLSFMPVISVGIRFSHVIDSAQEGTSGEIIEFDGDFEKEFFGVIGNLRIEG